MNVSSPSTNPSKFSLTILQNLLRVLTESQVQSAFPDPDLKLLLATVKEGRVSLVRFTPSSEGSDPIMNCLLAPELRS